MRVPHIATICLAILALLCFIYLNVHGWIVFAREPASTVTAMGWPVIFVGLSPDRQRMPVIDFEPWALVMDTALGLLATLGVGLASEKILKTSLPSAVAPDLRVLFLLVGFLGTLLAVLRYEYSTTGGYVLLDQFSFELARFGAYLAIAVAWCSLLRWKPVDEVGAS